MFTTKVTLAIVLAVFPSTGDARAGWSQTSNQQQQAPAPEMPQPGSGQRAPDEQQGGTPPVPCAPPEGSCTPAPEQPTQPAPAAKGASRQKTARHKVQKKQSAAQSTAGPKKKVVKEGGTSDPAAVLTPGATTETTYSRQMTAELLSAADANLKQATSRPLNSNEEETVSQVKLFIEQANEAMKAGDLDRGHNLAMKAHLLSEDLVKH